MTHPLSSRLVLLALAAALAASLVFAMVVAEQRDVDGRAAAFGASVTELLAAAAPVQELRAVPVSAP